VGPRPFVWGIGGNAVTECCSQPDKPANLRIMRSPAIALGVSLAVFGSAVATRKQEDPPAEKQFKNIQSFKGEKASDIIPAMQFMSASLKVDCDYCHTEDRSSDAKEEKKTAREMIAMQHDINAKFFRGRNQITCATCHAGHTHPINQSPVLGLEVRARRNKEVSPVAVLEAFGKASSGKAGIALAKVPFSAKGISTGKDGEAKFEATFAGENFVSKRSASGGDFLQGFNGHEAWFHFNKETHVVPLPYAIDHFRQVRIYPGPDALPSLDNPVGGTAKLGKKDALTVSGTIRGEKTRATYMFDKATGLLARTLFSYPTILGSIAQINDYDKYRSVKGIQLPTVVAIHSGDGDYEVQLKSIQFDPKTDAKNFDPPK
jgi:photosynthetic reaction center cytochrome c subunit